MAENVHDHSVGFTAPGHAVDPGGTCNAVLVVVAGLLALGFAVSCGGGEERGAGGTAGAAGGTGGGSGGADSEAAWNEYCNEAESRPCNEQLTCQAPATCIAELYDPVLVPVLIDCLLGLPCGGLTNDDPCWTTVGTVDGELPADGKQFLQACQSTLSSCSLSAATYRNLCGTVYPIIQRRFFDAVQTCIALDCAKLAPCLDAIRTETTCS